MKKLFVLTLFLCVFASTLCAQQPKDVSSTAPVTLFRNVRIFDGKGGPLSGPANVLVEGNRIARLSSGAIDLAKYPNASVIEGQGRVLMPGLIDTHWHAMMAGVTEQVGLTADIGYLTLVAGREAEATLLRGFTSVRDMGGPTFSLKRAIDQGIILGPRIYPSGAMISQTGGHGDLRLPYEVPRLPGDSPSHAEKIGISAIADSPDEVRRHARENLMQGASQLKLMAGGGVYSVYDPLDVTQYTVPEIRAAVEAAENWGTYVTVHAYTPRAVQAAIAAGVKCIEHGHMLDEATIKLMAEKGIWLDIQPFVEDPDAIGPVNPDSQRKFKEAAAGEEKAYRLAKKYHLKLGWGTDLITDPKWTQRQATLLTMLTRYDFTPAELLKMATADNGELLALSGPRNPYPGKLGVVQEGVLADLLLVEGNPLENLHLIEDPGKNFVVIMKDGKIYKNLLAK
jgi:imidazolonepropionase-like amidohydrolase